MLRLLKFLIIGDWHLHNWETIKEAKVEEGNSRYTRYYCKCKVCGIHRKFD